jgi:excisionase family DNA binding protein
MKVAEAARRLEVSQATIYSLVASGKLRCYRIGNGRGVIRIDEAHLLEYLAGSEAVTRPPVASAPARRVSLKHLRLS